MPTKRKTFSDLPPATLRAILDACEGHGILDPQWLIAQGVPAETLKPLVVTHKSDRSHWKSTLFGTDGEPVDFLSGVYDLELARRIVKDLGLTPEEPYFGRGSNCRHLVGQALAVVALREQSAARAREQHGARA